ncbi:MAG: 3'-5' exonuclease [Betaproteobacteria bacterium]
MPAPRKRKASPPVVAPAAAAPAAPAAAAEKAIKGQEAAVPPSMPDPQACAQWLDAHPDYRVLRRLPVQLDWRGAQALAITRIVVLDTETTGLEHAKDKIIELAMLRLSVDSSTGVPQGRVEVFDQLEDPGFPIPKEVTALTGLRDDDVQGQKLDEALIAHMLQGVDLVIAHNAGFDRPFCEARIPAFRDIPWACSFADIDWKTLGQSSSKLESLALAQGWFYDAHRAEMDCHALLAVLTAPLAQSPAEIGMARLLAAARAPSYRLYATHAPFESKDLLKARGYRWNAEQRVWFTRLGDEGALQTECQWLKAQAYGGRNAVVAIEQMDALGKYSSRPGRMTQRQL